MQVVLTSMQKVDNVIPNQERYVAFGYTLQVGVIKNVGDVRIYRPLIFCVSYGPNQ